MHHLLIIRVDGIPFSVRAFEAPLQMAHRFCTQFNAVCVRVVAQNLLMIVNAACNDASVLNRHALREAYSQYFEGVPTTSYRQNYTLDEIVTSKVVVSTLFKRPINRIHNLYEHGKNKLLRQRSQSREMIDKNDIIDENCTFKPKINRYSKMLTQKRSPKQLFDALDSDKDGLISRDAIDLKQISNQSVMQLLAVFNLIEDEDLQLNYEQFSRLATPYLC